MKRKYPWIYDDLQMNVLTITYTLSVIFIFYLLTILIQLSSVVWWILIVIFYLTASIILWVHLYALFSIPGKLSGAFDDIKNDISAGKINDPKTFASRFNEFLIDFYDFSFFDIEYAALNIKGKDIYFSSELIESYLDWDKLADEAKKSPEQIKHGSKLIDGIKYFMYSTPIWFGDEWLGYFTVFTNRRLITLNIKLLSELERNYLDDQLKHVLNNSKKYLEAEK